MRPSATSPAGQFLVMLYSVEGLTRKRYFQESCHSRILSWYHMDYISFESLHLGLWHRRDRLWWVFRYYSLSSNPDFLEPMLCSLCSCCDGVCLSNTLFLLDMHYYQYERLLLDVVGNERFFSLHYTDSGNWSFGTVQYRLVFDTWISWGGVSSWRNG